jgi:hypothetical protein
VTPPDRGGWRTSSLCRHITRPTPSDEQVQCNAVRLMKLKTPWLDGAMHQVMSAMKFMQRHIDRQLCDIEFCERYVS